MLHLQPPGLFFGAYMNMPNAFIAKCGRSLKAPPHHLGSSPPLVSPPPPVPKVPIDHFQTPRYYPHAIAQARGVPFPFLNVGLVGRSGA